MNKTLITILITGLVSVISIFNAGCETAQTSAILGTAAGAGLGQAIGRDTESTLLGAGIGAIGGYLLGNENEKKRTAAEMAYIREQATTVVVNVTNSNGSTIPVRLRKQGAGYIGTRGEYYASLPSEDQLRPVYGF